jgi:hypothetical protein
MQIFIEREAYHIRSGKNIRKEKWEVWEHEIADHRAPMSNFWIALRLRLFTQNFKTSPLWHYDPCFTLSSFCSALLNTHYKNSARNKGRCKWKCHLMQISSIKFFSMTLPAWQIWIILQMDNFLAIMPVFLPNRNYVFTALQMYNSLWLILPEMAFIVQKQNKTICTSFLCLYCFLW